MVEGLRRQEKRFDPADIDNLGAVDRGLAQKLASDAMLKAEHQKEDKTKAEGVDAQIEKLIKIQSRMKDGYGLNCDLRRQFRVCLLWTILIEPGLGRKEGNQQAERGRCRTVKEVVDWDQIIAVYKRRCDIGSEDAQFEGRQK